VALLSGCGPLPVPIDAHDAELSATVTADGDLDVHLMLGGSRSESDLVDIAGAVGRQLFSEAPTVVLEWDAAAAVDVLRRSGFRRVALDLHPPHVPTHVDWQDPPSDAYPTDWYWDESSASDAAPAGRIELSPQPARGFAVLALTALALLGVALSRFGLRRGRRGWATAGAAVASLPFLVVVTTAGLVQVDNLGVRGQLSGPAFRVVSALPLMTLPAAMAAWVLVTRTSTEGQPGQPRSLLSPG
jgi:hypothetical protein